MIAIFLLETAHIKKWLVRGGCIFPKAKCTGRYVGGCLVTKWEAE